MNVGLITYGLDRPLSGIGRYTTELANALLRLPERPHLTLLEAGSSMRLLNGGFRRVALPGCRLLPGLVTLGNLYMAWYARRLNLDVLHDPNGVAPFGVSVGRTKTMLSLHDVLPWSYPKTSSRLEHIIHRRWLPRVIGRVDTVITASEQSRKDILHFLPVSPDRLHVLPYAVAEGFRPIPKDDVRRMLVKKYDLQDPFLLCIGAANPRKNFNRLVDVFSRLSEDFPQLRLVVVGAQPKKPFTKDTASGPERSTRILHLGFVSDADLVLLYNGCAVFVYPSLYEGFGLPPLEAMACGAPVVCSDGSSLPEVAGDAALLVDPTDTRAVTEAVRNVLTHPDVACTMRRNGMQQARKFSWKQNASRTMELYRRLIDGKGA